MLKRLMKTENKCPGLQFEMFDEVLSQWAGYSCRKKMGEDYEQCPGYHLLNIKIIA